jgi:hypothetical protein
MSLITGPENRGKRLGRFFVHFFRAENSAEIFSLRSRGKWEFSADKSLQKSFLPRNSETKFRGKNRAANEKMRKNRKLSHHSSIVCDVTSHMNLRNLNQFKKLKNVELFRVGKHD